MATQQPKTAQSAADMRDALAGRLFQDTLGMMDVLAVYIGDKLGFYQSLAERPMTSTELSSRTGTHERYAREWLEQQAVTGILQVENAAAGPMDRRYSLPEGHREVLLDRDSLAYLMPLAQGSGVVAQVVPAVLQVFRSGGGIPYSAYGADAREMQALMNRPHYMKLLATQWLPSVPDVHARLQADPPARVADIGCGAGWSCIAIARAYPRVRVDGYDMDAPSIAMAQANAIAAGVADRVAFHARDAGDSKLAGQYDLVLAFEMVHDLSRPVDVLRTMRRIAARDGAVIVMDENVSEEFAAPGNDTDRLFYGFSIFWCLPQGMAESPSAATGTVMRPATLKRYAQEAGFRDVQILPIQHDFWRFYRLEP